MALQKRVWFNHWFSTAYHLINLIRDGNPDKFYFIGSNKNDYAVYKLACDEWHREPEKISDADYVDFCLNFCREHDVDIFIPRRNLTAIAMRVDDFNQRGVKVLVGDGRLTKILDDKVATYKFITAGGLDEIIPPYKIAATFDEFNRAYNALKTSDNRICYKLVADEGALTFRVIDDSIEKISALHNMPNMKVTLAAAQKILSRYDFKIPLIVMPYLSGQEVSVDCLTTSQGNIIIPRFKTNHRYSEIKFDAAIINVAEKILSLMKFDVPINIQFRMDGGKLYLLEINPRMSGGLQLSCLAAGVNIPDLAINQLLGVEKSWSLADKKSRRVANIETPVILDS